MLSLFTFQSKRPVIPRPEEGLHFVRALKTSHFSRVFGVSILGHSAKETGFCKAALCRNFYRSQGLM